MTSKTEIFYSQKLMIKNLDIDPAFPDPLKAPKHGLLAFAGDLSAERLIEAYSSGIFPWFDEDDPILWHSPDPRFIVFPHKIKISKTMRQIINRNVFEVRYDTAFEDVIAGCADSRIEGTWITDDMIEAYVNLHRLGFAHSVEAWQDGKLAGGLYGVSIGKAFFGESMFSKESNSSKFALISLAGKLERENFLFIDSQVHTDHVESMGGEFIPRADYIALLKKAVNTNHKWNS